MNENFSGLVFECNYVGVQSLSVLKGTEYEDRVLLYFSKEIDSAEVPLSLTEGQAQQLYRDLEKILKFDDSKSG